MSASDALFPAQKGIWKLMAYRKPVRVAIGRKGERLWARGDSEEDKNDGEEAELKIKGRTKVPSIMRWRGKL